MNSSLVYRLIITEMNRKDEHTEYPPILVLLFAGGCWDLPVKGTLGIRITDNLAGSKGGGKVLEEGSLFNAIAVAKEGDNGIGSLLRVVERNLGEQVVNDVVVDNLVEEVTSNEAESSVDGAKGSLDEGP